MKQTFFRSAVFFIGITLLIGAGIYFLTDMRNKVLPNETEKLIDSLIEFKQDKLIFPQSADEVRVLFDGVSHRRVPRIYIGQIPSDFASNGSRILFQKMMIPLILRENEKLARERMILQILNDKWIAGIPWTAKEHSFFDALAQRYDSFLKKTMDGKMADLLEKVDVIPPALAVAQAALVTDWGAKNLISPFGQYAWLDETHYDLKPFQTLSEAVTSYFWELNASAPLFEWRWARDRIRILPNQPKARRVIPFLKRYVPDDPEYVNTLRRLLSPDEIERLENAAFTSEGTE